MKKRHKVIMSPTEDKSNLCLNTKTGKFYNKGYSNDIQYQNLYIISDEEIKEGDWFIRKIGNILGVERYIKNDHLYSGDRKIIATTDKSLEIVSKGINPVYEKLPQIPQQFLEDFCKAGGIWEVELEYEEAFIHNYELKDKKSNLGHKFKITSNNEVIIHLIEENEIDKLFNWLSDRDYLSDDISVLKTEYINWIKENL